MYYTYPHTFRQWETSTRIYGLLFLKYRLSVLAYLLMILFIYYNSWTAQDDELKPDLLDFIGCHQVFGNVHKKDLRSINYLQLLLPKVSGRAWILLVVRCRSPNEVHPSISGGSDCKWLDEASRNIKRLRLPIVYKRINQKNWLNGR